MKTFFDESRMGTMLVWNRIFRLATWEATASEIGRPRPTGSLKFALNLPNVLGAYLDEPSAWIAFDGVQEPTRRKCRSL